MRAHRQPRRKQRQRKRRKPGQRLRARQQRRRGGKRSGRPSLSTHDIEENVRQRVSRSKALNMIQRLPSTCKLLMHIEREIFPGREKNESHLSDAAGATSVYRLRIDFFRVHGAIFAFRGIY